MRIGFLINDLSSGGAERATASLANYFVAQGEHVDIITFKDTESFYPLDSRVNISCAHLANLDKSASAKRIYLTAKRIAKLRYLIRKKKLDVLIGMSFYMVWYAVLSTKFTRTKSVGTERTNPYTYKATKMHTLLRKTFYHFTNGYVFQTQKAADFFSKNHKRDAIIPNAIYNEKIYSLSPPENREKTICGVGRLCQLKRFDILIESFALISKQIPDYTLVIYGEGEKREELQDLIYSLGLQEKISMPGAFHNAVEFVNNASVFVLSSELEGMPNALMESMSMGVPCVSTRCNMGPEELIDDGVNGLLVNVNDKQQMAYAVLKVIKNNELARTLSENAVKLLDTNSIDKISNRWLEYLKSI